MSFVFLLKFVDVFFDILFFALFARVLLSWIYPFGHHHSNRIVSIIFDSTEPLLNLARKVPHRIGMIDLSPIIAFIMIEIARYLILSALASLIYI
ncbi:MAG: hypothetical protein US89_C0004G0020 [Candidatus Peregrinibacteria bacterium GW2011_GWF2_38_29]|nr:MAG: hypothetical protein US89_C0004G0020 [Candidatus Peregrinibacteria bacterium GW2011_GWF2_38_29]HBB02957.1 YggT family protein [Candidatus Peregrinibacteria bacterium]